jgi:hypothetical protein
VVTKRLALGIAALSLLLATGASCRQSGDDVVRNADEGIEYLGRLLNGRADDAAHASKQLDGLTTAVRDAHVSPAIAARQRLDDLVATARIPQEIEDAFAALTWDATCAVVLGEVPADAASIASWLREWALNYGVQFYGLGADQWGESISSSLQSEEAWTDAESMCSMFGGVLLD